MMPKWRQRELQQQSGRRAARLGSLFRPATLIVALSLVLAIFALWQAMAAQARADRLEHDLGVAVARLRDMPAAPLLPSRLRDTAADVGPASAAALPPPPPSPFRSPQTGVQ